MKLFKIHDARNCCVRADLTVLEKIAELQDDEIAFFLRKAVRAPVAKESPQEFYFRGRVEQWLVKYSSETRKIAKQTRREVELLEILVVPTSRQVPQVVNKRRYARLLKILDKVSDLIWQVVKWIILLK